MKRIFAIAGLFLFLLAAGHVASGQTTDGLEPVRILYPNGKVQIEGTTRNGKKQGHSKTYYENGQVRSEVNWDNDVQVGKTKRWFENGTIHFEGQMANGKETGEWKNYDELDGRYFCSVWYKDGEVVDYKYPAAKYRWRRINSGSFKLSFDFPLYAMGEENTGALRTYWTMYPFKSKRDFEFYMVGEMPMYVVPGNLDSVFGNGLEREKAFLSALYQDATSADPHIPNIGTDKYELKLFSRIVFKNRPAYKISILFTDYELSFDSLLLPVDGQLYLISAYFNKDVDQKTRDRFWSGIEVKP